MTQQEAKGNKWKSNSALESCKETMAHKAKKRNKAKKDSDV